MLSKSNPTVRKLLHGLVKSRWLHRLQTGKYLIIPLSAGADAHYTINELVIAAHLVTPYYISYWTLDCAGSLRLHRTTHAHHLCRHTSTA